MELGAERTVELFFPGRTQVERQESGHFGPRHGLHITEFASPYQALGLEILYVIQGSKILDHDCYTFSSGETDTKGHKKEPRASMHGWGVFWWFMIYPKIPLHPRIW